MKTKNLFLGFPLKKTKTRIADIKDIVLGDLSMYQIRLISVRLIGGTGHNMKIVIQPCLYLSIPKIKNMQNGFFNAEKYKIGRFKNGNYYGKLIKK